MTYKIVGIEKTEFTSKTNPEQIIKGINVYLLYENRNTIGARTAKEFLSENLLRKSGCRELKINDEIEISYNRYGSKDYINIIEE